MSTKGLIPKLLAREVIAVKSCEICVSAKLIQFPYESESESTKYCQHKLERVHMDLIGPIAVSSHNGRLKYFQASIDVSTRYSTVNLLQSKSDALKETRKSLSLIELESGCRLKSLRIDGGGVYTSTEWKAEG